MTITGADGVEVLQRFTTLEAGQFARDRSADYRFEVPLLRLQAGEYPLTLKASVGEQSERRDVRFSVK